MIKTIATRGRYLARPYMRKPLREEDLGKALAPAGVGLWWPLQYLAVTLGGLGGGAAGIWYLWG